MRTIGLMFLLVTATIAWCDDKPKKSEFIRMPNGGHVWAKDWAGFPGVIGRWFDEQLKIAR